MMMDWAKEIADELTTEWTYSHSVDASNIAAALVKSKIEGFWQGVQVASDSLTEAFQAAREGKDVDTGGLMAKLVLIAADIDKGNA